MSIQYNKNVFKKSVDRLSIRKIENERLGGLRRHCGCGSGGRAPLVQSSRWRQRFLLSVFSRIPLLSEMKLQSWAAGWSVFVFLIRLSKFPFLEAKLSAPSQTTILLAWAETLGARRFWSGPYFFVMKERQMPNECPSQMWIEDFIKSLSQVTKLPAKFLHPAEIVWKSANT